MSANERIIEALRALDTATKHNPIARVLWLSNAISDAIRRVDRAPEYGAFLIAAAEDVEGTATAINNDTVVADSPRVIETYGGKKLRIERCKWLLAVSHVDGDLKVFPLDTTVDAHTDRTIEQELIDGCAFVFVVEGWARSDDQDAL